MRLQFLAFCIIIINYISMPLVCRVLPLRTAEDSFVGDEYMTQITSFFTAIYNNLQLLRFTDLIDIAIVAYVIYKLTMVVRKTHAFRLAKGVGVLVLVLVVSEVLNLTMITYFITKGLELGLIALVILFQPELRRILERLGSGRFARLLSGNSTASVANDTAITQIAIAVKSMSESRTGALMVFERHSNLTEYMNTGTAIHADISSELIRNIFFEPAPLHDGALIIREGKIAAAGCMLPLSNNNTLSHDMGMRHRAAIGMSEHSDAVVAVVSEETGAISVAINGMIKRHLDVETFEEILRSELVQEAEEKAKHTDKLVNILSNLKVKKNEKTGS